MSEVREHSTIVDQGFYHDKH